MVRPETWKPQTTQQSVYAYALLWSGVAFGMGILLSWWELPAALVESDIESWKAATWVWLNAHGIGIAGEHVGGVEMMFQTVTFINDTPRLHLLRIVPIGLTAFTALLVAASMGKIRAKYILENCVAAAIGYVFVGLGAIVVSDARPGVGMLVGVMVALAAAAYLGSMFANALPIPVFAITSLGALALIGLFAIGGAVAVGSVLMPLVQKAGIGVSFAAVVMWVASNLGR